MTITTTSSTTSGSAYAFVFPDRIELMESISVFFPTRDSRNCNHQIFYTFVQNISQNFSLGYLMYGKRHEYICLFLSYICLLWSGSSHCCKISIDYIDRKYRLILKIAAILQYTGLMLHKVRLAAFYEFLLLKNTQTLLIILPWVFAGQYKLIIFLDTPVG